MFTITCPNPNGTVAIGTFRSREFAEAVSDSMRCDHGHDIIEFTPVDEDSRLQLHCIMLNLAGRELTHDWDDDMIPDYVWESVRDAD